MPATTPAADRLAGTIAADCVGTRVARLHRMVSRAYERALKPTGLTLPQLEILTALTVQGGAVKPAALADVLLLERSTLSRNLALMRNRGWVTPTGTSATGRAMAVVIAPPGVTALLAAQAAWAQAQADVVASLGADAGEILDGWLATGG